jgi:hypothetical protein
VHSAGRTCTADGRWRPKRGIDPAVVEQAEAAAMRAPIDPESTEQAPADPRPDAPADAAPDSAAWILAGITAAQTADLVSDWEEEARLADLTPEERAAIDQAAESRRAELAGG